MEPPQHESRSSDAGEQRVIDRLLTGRRAPPPFVTLDAGHDCAVVYGQLALTTDSLVQGVHFDDRTSAEDVGYKVVAVSVSDLAAARATPEWMLLALSLPAPDGWLEGFARGLQHACDRFGVYLIGGDVTRSERVVVTSTLGGALRGAARSRSGARPGDEVWVTGWPGLAGIGWMSTDPPPEALAALRRPAPPVPFALALEVATAAMDLSDGLMSDLPRLCAASGVGAVIDAQTLPLHPSIAGDEERLRAQLAGGDDYELLFTAPASARDRVLADAAAAGTKATVIGRVVAEGLHLVGALWPSPAFAHFAEAP